MTFQNRTVLVGTDGSPAARAAVRWAADEARRRDTTLIVMCAFTPEPVLDGNLSERHYLDLGAEHAGIVLANAELQAHELAPALPVRRAAMTGRPASLLLTAARSVGLAVVGHRGHSGIQDLLLGSVAQALAAHAPCPVAVVRGRTDRSIGQVLVGVDPSSAGSHAVELAFDQADTRGCGLVAIRAFRSPEPPWGADISPSIMHLEKELEAERRVLDEVLEPWRSKYPQVPVETRMSRFDAVHALTEASLGAQLVVIGSRGSGMLSGNLFGSVSMHLLQHADCPVLVAHA